LNQASFDQSRDDHRAKIEKAERKR